MKTLLMKRNIRDLPVTSLPYADNNLQQGANTRDEKDGADEVTLCEAIMLQTKPLGQDQRNGNNTSKCSQTVLKNMKSYI